MKVSFICKEDCLFHRMQLIMTVLCSPWLIRTCSAFRNGVGNAKSGTVTHPGAVGLGAASQDKGSCCIKGSFFLYEKVTVLPISIARWSRKWKGYSEFENRGTLWIPIHFSGRIIKKEDPQCQQQQEMESYCQNNYNWRTGPTGTAGQFAF